MQTKRCPKCQTTKLHSDFHRNRAQSDGLAVWCRDCWSQLEKTPIRRAHHKMCRANWFKTPVGRALQHAAEARYNRTVKGIANSLRKAHSLSLEESVKWALILKNPNTRCSICGIPNRILVAYTKTPHWLLGRNRRLELDHIQPGVNNGNYRPACRPCNTTRGAARLTDSEVLQIVRAQWEFSTGLRFLFWLNFSPGVGGREFRSERTRRFA